MSEVQPLVSEVKIEEIEGEGLVPIPPGSEEYRTDRVQFKVKYNPTFDLIPETFGNVTFFGPIEVKNAYQYREGDVVNYFAVSDRDAFELILNDIRQHGFLDKVPVDETGDVLGSPGAFLGSLALGLECPYQVIEGLDFLGKKNFVRSRGLLRRDLTPKERKAIIEAAVIDDFLLPEKEHQSDRSLGDELKLSHRTIDAIRRRMERVGRVHVGTEWIRIVPIRFVRSKDGKLWHRTPASVKDPDFVAAEEEAKKKKKEREDKAKGEKQKTKDEICKEYQRSIAGNLLDPGNTVASATNIVRFLDSVDLTNPGHRDALVAAKKADRQLTGKWAPSLESQESGRDREYILQVLCEQCPEEVMEASARYFAQLEASEDIQGWLAKADDAQREAYTRQLENVVKTVQQLQSKVRGEVPTAAVRHCFGKPTLFVAGNGRGETDQTGIDHQAMPCPYHSPLQGRSGPRCPPRGTDSHGGACPVRFAG